MLKVGYSVDKRVQGTITLSSGRPVQRGDVIAVLEGALNVIGSAVVREGQIYKVFPAADAIGAGPAQTVRSDRLEPGFGITVLPQLYVSSLTLQPALEGFAARPGAIRIDTARNLLLIQGTSAERASAVEAALSLDVDWMRDQSVGVFPLRSANPEAVVGEFQGIFSTGKEPMSQGLVRFQPIARLNGILVVAQTPDQLSKARKWIYRLEKSGSGYQLRVYRVRYANVRTLAANLRDVFTGSGDGPSPSIATAANRDLAQIAPGSGTARSIASVTPPGARALLDNSSISGRSAQSDQADASSQWGPYGAMTGSKSANLHISADLANNALLTYSSNEQYRVIEQAMIKLDRGAAAGGDRCDDYRGDAQQRPPVRGSILPAQDGQLRQQRRLW